MTKKILMITRNLPPLIGGMERLNWHIADELSKDSEIDLLSHKNAREHAPKNCYFHGVPLNPLPIFLLFTFFKTFWICLKRCPDILFAGSGLTAPIVVFWAKLFNKKSVVYIHGLDIENNSYIYKLIWIPFICYSDHIVCNSTPTKKLCLEKNIPSEKISIIFPGVTYPPHSRNNEFLGWIEKKYDLYNKKIILSVGRLTDRKGILEFVSNSFPEIIKSIPNVLLIIVGDTAKNALNNKYQSKDIILDATETRNNILFTGAVNEEVLSGFFYLANIHVFPVKYIPSDPEGFGMVAIEAAAHGTPTVAFSTGGVVDSVENGKSGFLIEQNNYEMLSEAIIELLVDSSLINESECCDFAKNFSWDHMREQLIGILNKLSN